MILLLAACMADDYTGEPLPTKTDGSDTDVPTGTGTGPSIVGSWLSEGEDLSPLFAADPFSYQWVTADFAADGSYSSQVLLADNTTVDVAGTWTAGTGTDPASITLVQTTPYEATAVGIWAVDGDTLTYEVVQTEPDYGYTAPTPERGFGSTAGPGLAPDSNIQIYRRQ